MAQYAHISGALDKILRRLRVTRTDCPHALPIKSNIAISTALIPVITVEPPWLLVANQGTHHCFNMKRIAANNAIPPIHTRRVSVNRSHFEVITFIELGAEQMESLPILHIARLDHEQQQVLG